MGKAKVVTEVASELMEGMFKHQDDLIKSVKTGLEGVSGVTDDMIKTAIGNRSSVKRHSKSIIDDLAKAAKAEAGAAGRAGTKATQEAVEETVEAAGKKVKFDLSGQEKMPEKYKRGNTSNQTYENRKQYDIDMKKYEYNQTMKEFGEGKNEDVNKILGKKLGVKPEEINNAELMRQKIEDHYQSQVAKITTREKGLQDSMIHHKVPQKTAALGGTAWLVSNMSASKGQMSNAQLYGQSAPYGGGGGGY